MRLMERMFGSHHGGHHGTVGTTTKSIVVNMVTTVDSTFDKMNNVGDVRVRQHPLPQSVRDGACACCVQQMQWSASGRCAILCRTRQSSSVAIRKFDWLARPFATNDGQMTSLSSAAHRDAPARLQTVHIRRPRRAQ